MAGLVNQDTIGIVAAQVGKACQQRAHEPAETGLGASSARSPGSTSPSHTSVKSGPAMTVVPIAISTSITKSVGVMSPRSRPMLARISSTMPRAFISVPMASAWRGGAPLSRAAAQHAPPFAAHAAANTAAVISHSGAESSSVRRVFRPE